MSTDDSSTKPTIETVLERINTLGEMLSQRLGGVEGRIGGVEGRMGGIDGRLTGIEGRITSLEDRLTSEISQLRNDVNQGFRRVERKIQLLNNDFLSMRGDHEDVLRRVEDLESKAS